MILTRETNIKMNLLKKRPENGAIDGGLVANRVFVTVVQRWRHRLEIVPSPPAAATAAAALCVSAVRHLLTIYCSMLCSRNLHFSNVFIYFRVCIFRIVVSPLSRTHHYFQDSLLCNSWKSSCDSWTQLMHGTYHLYTSRLMTILYAPSQYNPFVHDSNYLKKDNTTRPRHLMIGLETVPVQ